MSRRRQLYEGKAKILYEGPEPGTIIQYFKDDATAFNAQKKGTINGKGVINNRISEHVFLRLAHIGIPTHFIRRLNMREQLVRQVEIIPLEVVVRNVAAGSLSKRLGMEEGEPLPHTLIEYYLKSDELQDPMVAEEHIACFGWANNEEMQDIAAMAIRVNDFMCGMFAAIDIRLIDFKLEFGRIWDGDYSRLISSARMVRAKSPSQIRPNSSLKSIRRMSIAANMPHMKSFTRIAIAAMSCISSLLAQPKQAMCSSATIGSCSSSDLR